MGAPLTFYTPVDRFVRKEGLTRRQFAERSLISASTLMKARALEEGRGRIHWTSLFLIGIQMGVFRPGEAVAEDDPRFKKLAGSLVSSRGRGAPNYGRRYR